MRPRSTALRTIGAFLGVGLLACAWLTFGPKQLGGPATYALIEGNSMEPMLHQGDLAVVRSKSSYDVGDVVAYHSAELDRLVLHRIIDRDGAAFILQGDNNDFLDSAQPTTEQIAGELSVTLPKAGATVGRLRSPAGFVVMLGLAGIALGTGRHGSRRGAEKSEGKERPNRRGAGATPARESRAGLTGGLRSVRSDQLQTIIGIAGGAAAVLTLVTAIAYSRSTVETTVVPDLYEHTGTFSYSADVPKSPVYDSTTAADGDAIFTALANDVDFQFNYQLTSDEPHSVSGTAALVAKITDGEGLERTLRLAPQQEFAGDTVALSGTLTLAKLQRLINRIQKATETVSNGYFVTLEPQIAVSGQVGDTALDDRFAPTLVFNLDPARLALAQTSALDETANALERVEMGSGSREMPATFGVLGFNPTVTTARTVGLFGALSALAVFLGALRLTRAPRGNDRMTIAARHGQWLVRAANGTQPDKRCIELATMDDLVRVAELREQLVLEVDTGVATTYVVDDGSVQYSYSTSEETTGRPTQPPIQRRPVTPERAQPTTAAAPPGTATDPTPPAAMGRASMATPAFAAPDQTNETRAHQESTTPVPGTPEPGADDDRAFSERSLSDWFPLANKLSAQATKAGATREDRQS